MSSVVPPAKQNANAGDDFVEGYGGDISCHEAWWKLCEEPACELVDVRTRAEWNFVGVPDLSSISKSTLLVEWLGFPDPSPIPDFAARLKDALRSVSDSGESAEKRSGDLLFLCRSGTRSRAAAMAAADAGLGRCFNVMEGFEGPVDSSGHRCSIEGWKVAGLPWRQN